MTERTSLVLTEDVIRKLASGAVKLSWRHIARFVCMLTYNDGIKEDLIGGIPSTDGNNRIAFNVFGWKTPNEN